MAVFGGLKITNDGITLNAKAQMGKELKFKRIALGDGELGSSESILNLTELKNETLSLDIYSIQIVEENKVNVSFVLKNEELEEGFQWRELGVIAEDPDTLEEKLYCYGNAGENGEYISAGGGAEVLEKYVNIIFSSSNAESVVTTIDKSLIFINKSEIIDTIEDCIGEKEKVPSADLFFQELNKRKTTVFNTYTVITNIEIVANSNYTLPSQYKVGMNTLFVYYMGMRLAKGRHYIEVGEEGELSNTIQFTMENIAQNKELQFVFVEYVLNEEIDYNTLNNRINAIYNKVNQKQYSITTQSGITANTDYTLPFSYTVGANMIDAFYEGALLAPTINYAEVGEEGSVSDKIQFGWNVEKGSLLQFIRRGDENG